jgi:pseudaminic acid biosynthesis-associated methylase
MRTKEMEFWSGDFGSEYTDRNSLTTEKLDLMYVELYGTPRSVMNGGFLSNLPRDIRILEVGCNIGNQLRCLQSMGFSNLYGIELQDYAVEKAKQTSKNINIIQGSIFDIPFKDQYFDLVFTSGVLIHVSPQDIDKALVEIHRVSNQYIWGFEYYSENYEGISYRGHSDKMWKTNFAKLYQSKFANLFLEKHELFPYLKEHNVDQMFLLKKG